MLDNASQELMMSADQRRWHRERRSAWLRLVALAVLIVNLGLASRPDSVIVHVNVIAAYGVATIVALLLAELRWGARWFAWIYIVFDALLVVVLFHEHLFAPSKEVDHTLTAPSLAIGFLLLMHVALRLRPMMVALFSSLVILGWLTLLTVAVEAHLGKGEALALDWSSFLTEAALAAAFGFAALVCGLLTYDHNVLLKAAVLAERRRASLSRFFSPTVLTELQATGASLALAQRDIAVLFVDLRSFTRLSESIPPASLANLLVEFRELVTREVFAHGGMIDKFIGDGVMAAFGQPKSTPDDAARALECALHLTTALRGWRDARERRGEIGPQAGVGIHFGTAIGGVLRSGSHDEFTLVGDVVNVAQRLEQLCKPLGASIVASWEVITAAGGAMGAAWSYENDVELQGRVGRMRIGYLLRDTGAIEPRSCREGSLNDE